jgi:mRNA-degrading endonuclease toxin of MazEF toxin-antitoxin module
MVQQRVQRRPVLVNQVVVDAESAFAQLLLNVQDDFKAVAVQPPDGGLKVESLILCHQLRTISAERLAKRAGVVPDGLLAEVGKRLALALGF